MLFSLQEKEGAMSKVPRSADLLVNLVMSRPGEIEKLKENPEKTLRDLASETTKELIPPVLKREVGIYYVVVGALGFVAVSTVIGAIFLTAAATVKIPDVITALGSAAIGALAGLLAPSPKEA
jgi:hypothetical protein